MSVLTVDEYRKALAKWHVPVVEHVVDGVKWYQHGRPLDGWRDPWDAHAIAVHDTVTGGLDTQHAVNLCWSGKPGVPGPLYSGVVGYDGKLHLIGFGITNNVGKCDKQSYELAANDRLKLTAINHPGADDWGQANSHCYGYAYQTAGTDPLYKRVVQDPVMFRTLAAVCDAHHWQATSVINHKELTGRKNDVQYDKDGEIRRKVAALLRAGPGTVTPTPVSLKITEADARAVIAVADRLRSQLG